MDAVRVSLIEWRKSSFSGANSDCVELARTPHATIVRDSKNPGGPVLVFPLPAFAQALRSLAC